jgi:hypothetical protein
LIYPHIGQAAKLCAEKAEHFPHWGLELLTGIPPQPRQLREPAFSGTAPSRCTQSQGW